MYQSDGMQMELFNEIAQFAMLNDLFYRIQKPNDYMVEINGSEYDSSFEFIRNFKNKPETVRLIVKEFEQNFLYNIADSEEKPSTWTPEEFIDWYMRTFEFICDKEVFAPSVEDWTPFDTKYNKDNKNFDRIELILALCFKTTDDGFIPEFYKEQHDKIKDKKSFKDACLEVLKLYEITDSDIEDYVESLCDEAEQLYKEYKEEDKSTTKVEVYQIVFENNFDLETIEDYAFYDCDYMCYYEGYTDEQIKDLG